MTFFRRACTAAVARFRDLPLLWKLLLPYGALLLAVGLAIAFVLVRFTAEEAQSDLDQILTRQSVAAEAFVRDTGLYLAEAAQVGANLEGIAEAIAAGDTDGVTRLAANIAASRTDLDRVVIVDLDAVARVETERAGGGFDIFTGSTWAHEPVQSVLRGEVGVPSGIVALLPTEDGRILGSIVPVTAGGAVAGAVITGIDAGSLAAEITSRLDTNAAIYAADGALVGASGPVPPRVPARVSSSPLRETRDIDGEEHAVLYTSLEVRDVDVGTLAVGVPTEPFLGSVGSTGVRLSLLLLVAMVAVLGIGFALSRAILRQVRPLVATNKALGRGDLSARAEVLGADELGQLADGLNLVAEQLEASRDELERKVTERTEELHHLYDQLNVTVAGRSQYFTGLVHDLRAQLYVISGLSELMADPHFTPDHRRWRIDFGTSINSAVRELTLQVDEILELGRAESGNVDLERAMVQPAEIIDSVRSPITALARAAELTVSFEVAPDLPPLPADARRITSVVMNLVSNAIKYTPAGGAVMVRARRTPEGVEVAVSDTGVGIPEEAMTHVFEPFYRVAGTRTQRGEASSGIGLALAKRVVEAHGGRIWFESAVGGGTTFTFVLPASDDASTPNGARTPPRRQTAKGGAAEARPRAR